jgi:hypothetical protein
MLPTTTHEIRTRLNCKTQFSVQRTIKQLGLRVERFLMYEYYISHAFT